MVVARTTRINGTKVSSESSLLDYVIEDGLGHGTPADIAQTAQQDADFFALRPCRRGGWHGDGKFQGMIELCTKEWMDKQLNDAKDQLGNVRDEDLRGLSVQSSSVQFSSESPTQLVLVTHEPPSEEARLFARLPINRHNGDGKKGGIRGIATGWDMSADGAIG